jgi:hypothetical protein
MHGVGKDGLDAIDWIDLVDGVESEVARHVVAFIWFWTLEGTMAQDGRMERRRRVFGRVARRNRRGRDYLAWTIKRVMVRLGKAGHE